MKKYDGRIPLDRICMLRWGISITLNGASSDGASSIKSVLLKRMKDDFRLMLPSETQGWVKVNLSDVQLKWMDDDEEEEDDGNDAAMEKYEKRHGSGAKKLALHMILPAARVPQLYASGFVCFEDEAPMRHLPWASRRNQPVRKLEEDLRTIMTPPFLPLLKLPSMQSLRYLCLNMDPILLTCVAPYLPPTIVTLQVTATVIADSLRQIYLPSDLAQRMQHCQQLRQFIILHRVAEANYLQPVYACTPLSSLYVLQELSATLPGLETIQWIVPINSTRLLLEYEKMCKDQEETAISAAIDAVSASASTSSSSSLHLCPHPHPCHPHPSIHSFVVLHPAFVTSPP